MTTEEHERLDNELLRHLRLRRAILIQLLEETNELYEDGIYRFYHQSFKVYGLQEQTKKIVDELRGLRPYIVSDRLNPWFEDMLVYGAGEAEFKPEHNEEWAIRTRPFVEAFLHARYFLEMAVQYGDMKTAPMPMPSGWAALLCLYNIR